MRSGSANELGAMLATPKLARYSCHSPIALSSRPDEPCKNTTTGTRDLVSLGALAIVPAYTAPPVTLAGNTTAARCATPVLDAAVCTKAVPLISPTGVGGCDWALGVCAQAAISATVPRVASGLMNRYVNDDIKNSSNYSEIGLELALKR